MSCLPINLLDVNLSCIDFMCLQNQFVAFLSVKRLLKKNPCNLLFALIKLFYFISKFNFNILVYEH